MPAGDGGLAGQQCRDLRAELVIAAMLLGVGTFMVLRFGGSRHD